jgi:hypothetical protein
MDISGANQKMIGAIGGNLIRKTGSKQLQRQKGPAKDIHTSCRDSGGNATGCPGFRSEIRVGWLTISMNHIRTLESWRKTKHGGGKFFLKRSAGSWHFCTGSF